MQHAGDESIMEVAFILSGDVPTIPNYMICDSYHILLSFKLQIVALIILQAKQHDLTINCDNRQVARAT